MPVAIPSHGAVPTPLKADVTSCQRGLMPISREVCASTQGWWGEGGVTQPQEFLLIGPKFNSWERGDTKFLLYSQLISCFCQDITVVILNILVCSPYLHMEAWLLSPETGKACPRSHSRQRQSQDCHFPHPQTCGLSTG